MTDRKEARAPRWWELAAFAAPSTPILALSLPSLIFLAPHYNEYLGLSLTAVSAIFLTARIADIIIDPMIGSFQDRTTPKMGRRRFWIAASTPVLMLMVWIAFIGLQPGVAAPVVTIVVLVMYAAFASLTIAHLSWAGELQPDYHGRTRTLGAVQIAGMIGYVAMLVLPAVVRGNGGSADEAVRWMGYAALIALPATVAWCVLVVKEAPSPPQPHLGLKEAFAAIRENAALRRVLVPDLLIGVGYGVTGGLFVFLFRYHLDFPRHAEVLLLIYFLSGLLAVPFWTWLGRRVGKHRALQWGSIHAAIMLAAVPFMPKGDFWVAAGVLVIAGFSQSAGTMLLRAMMADVVDEDAARTGGQRSGLFFGLLLTTSKVGVAVGPLTYAILDIYGFDAALGANNSPAAMMALVALYAGIPLALNLVAAASLIAYPLDEARQRALRETIAARVAAD